MGRLSLYACVAGFFLDLLFGDPVWLFHPVRLIGELTELLERQARRVCQGSPKRLRAAGGILWVAVAVPCTVLPWALLWIAGRIHPAAAFLLETFWCYQILAVRSLRTESMKVYRELKRGDLGRARQAVSMIVGRDTDRLDMAGVTRAAVETVAENTSDGVVAPLFYLLIGGAPLGFAYKAVNTMDSMLGYKDEKYRDIGWIPARADDVANYLPARFSAVLMLASTALLRLDVRNAWRIFRRDRYQHASPNSAQTEAVCAGALRIALAGGAWYFGRVYKKPVIGDALREIEADDIVRAVRLLYVTAVLAMAVGGLIKYGALMVLDR